MKTLSLKEPWAALVVEGRKTIELRSWTTPHRGPLLIHRSGPGGGIVGMVEVVDVFPIGSFEQFRALRDRHHAPDPFYQPKLFGWVLRNARPVPFIPCKGRLRLWEFSGPVD